MLANTQGKLEFYSTLFAARALSRVPEPKNKQFSEVFWWHFDEKTLRGPSAALCKRGGSLGLPLAIWTAFVLALTQLGF